MQLLLPHRIFLLTCFLGLIAAAVYFGDWSWLPSYYLALVMGVCMTLALLISTSLLGFLLAIAIGLALLSRKALIKVPARALCSVIRGTPLLLQIWMLYYGLGALFPRVPLIRSSVLWPYLREGWPYAALALTVSFMAYAGEVMRGALAGIPHGELEAGTAFGMSRFTVFRRIWLPRAIRRALPMLGGESILQLKATPLVSTITVVDVYSVVSKIRQDTYITYEPLLLLTMIYFILAAAIVLMFRVAERRMAPL